MKKKYEKFAEDFEEFCMNYTGDDFDCQELIEVCKDIINNYGE